MSDAVSRMLEAAHRRISLAIGRCVLRAAAASGGRVQVEVLKGELMDAREHLQSYGFSSHPLPGARGVTGSVGGSRNNAVILVLSDPRYRPELGAGDAAMHDHRQQIIRLSETGIEIDTPLDVTIKAVQNVTITAAERLRLQAPNIEIAATAALKLDAGGYGETWQPNGRATWTTGTSSLGQSSPQPPEHP